MTVDELLARFEQQQKELEIEEQNTVKRCEQCEKEIFVGDRVGQIKKANNWLEVCGNCDDIHHGRLPNRESYANYIRNMERFNDALTNFATTASRVRW